MDDRNANVRGMSRRALLLSAGAAGAAATLAGGRGTGLPRAAGSEHARLPIGMNLAGIADWEPGFPFLNMMWGARMWMTRGLSGRGPWDTKLTARLELDVDGYPLELPLRAPEALEPQFVVTLLPNAVAAGRYVVLYDGEGDLHIGANIKVHAVRPGRIEIYMAQRGGDGALEEIGIRRSQRGNHVRNIRVVPIAHEAADLARNPFRPEVVEFARHWHCLRFMDWQQTNGSVNRHWAERKRRSFYTQVGVNGDAPGIFGNPLPAFERKWASGVATELCIELANLARTDAWLCVPHLADDEYITEMARLVKERLDPALKVYVEFSNELWNWSFPQAQWMLRSELAGELAVAGGSKPPWQGGAKPKHFRDGLVVEGAGQGADHPERTAALFRRAFRIWEQVFTGADRRRLVRVCAVQSAWYDTVRRTLEWVNRNGGCDALSPAGYFGANEAVYKRWDAAGARLTADDVVADMRSAIKAQADEVARNAALARKAGVSFVVYEGGQHIEPEGHGEKAYAPALGAVQKHPAMYELYRRHLDDYAKAGCSLFAAFSSVGRQGTRWGSWGHLERYGQDPAEMPKYRAILEANRPRSAT